jgi:hypothetical protein
MAIRRPALGAPYDKRLDAAALATQQAARAFNPALDLDLLDEIEAELAAQIAAVRADIPNIAPLTADVAGVHTTLTAQQAELDALEASVTAQLAAVRAEIKADAPGAYLGLVRNGGGILGTNSNFDSTTFNSAETAAGGGSFQTVGAGVWYADDFIALDPARPHRLSAYAKTDTPGGVFFIGLACYDLDQLLIEAPQWSYISGTLTTLTQPLNPGDMVIHVASTAGWLQGGEDYQRSVIVWDYQNSKGYTYPPETYSRHNHLSAYGAGALTPQTIPLLTAWQHQAAPVGTPLSNGTSGGTFTYIAAVGEVLDSGGFRQFQGRSTGVTSGGARDGSGLPVATAFVRPVWLRLGVSGTAKTLLNMVQLSEVVT